MLRGWFVLLALVLLACSDDGPCANPGAERIKGVCKCPQGTRLEAVASHAECLADEASDPAGARDGGAKARDAAQPADSSVADGAADPDTTDAALADAAIADASPVDAAVVDAGPSCVPSEEVCDGADNDCDTQVDEGVQNACGTCGTIEHPVGEACSNGGQGTCAKPGKYNCFNGTTVCDAPPATPSSEVCDGMDNDCAGGVDNGLLNACGGTTCGADLSKKGTSCTAGTGDCQGTGTWECAGPAANTLKCTATEKPKNACGTTCGPIPPEDCSTPADDNCNGQNNEGCCTPVTWYRDCDADGFAAANAASQSSCTAPSPPAGCTAWTKTAPGSGTTDCNDGNPAYKPGAEATYLAAGNGDFNCDGQVEKTVVVRATTAGTPAPANAPLCSDTVFCPCLSINGDARDFDHLDGATPVDAAGQPLNIPDGAPYYGGECAVSKRFVERAFYAIPIASNSIGCTTAVTEASHSIDIYYLQVLCR